MDCANPWGLIEEQEGVRDSTIQPRCTRNAMNAHMMSDA